MRVAIALITTGFCLLLSIFSATLQTSSASLLLVPLVCAMQHSVRRPALIDCLILILLMPV